ncbi:MAG: hypothetical protein RTU63_01545 [Candidatus Thorarchaeota archaeon]
MNTMNDSFIEESNDFPIITQRDLILIIVGGVISTAMGYLISYPIHLDSFLMIAPMLNTVNTVGMTLTLGVFPFLTAGVLFSSRSSRLYIRTKVGMSGIRVAYRTRILHVLIITSIFTVILTVLGLVIPMLLDPFAFVSLNLIPITLVATVTVSILLSLVASGLACIVDDSRVCVLLSFVSTYVIAIVAGLYPIQREWNFQITRNLSLLSPHNLVRGLAVQLSGYPFESPTDMVRYTGFTVLVVDLIIALLAFSSVAIFLVFVGQKTLSRNIPRWSILKNMTPVDEKWDATDTPEILQKLGQVKRSLRKQRGLAVLVVGILLVSLFVGGSMYNTYLRNSTTVVHYRTPGVMENIQLGSWITFDVDVPPPHPGLFNQLSFSFHLITMGDTTGSISTYIAVLYMTSAEFDLLNETSRHELTFGWLNQSSGGRGIGVGENLENTYGSYICVMKIIADSDPLSTSYIEGSLEIVREAL